MLSYQFIIDSNKEVVAGLYNYSVPNINLINGILLIHPIILYYSYIYIIQLYSGGIGITKINSYMYIYLAIILGAW